jgi:membrane-bound lytic murein transglycosylase MltF
MRTFPRWLLAITLFTSSSFSLAQLSSSTTIDSEVWTGTYEQMLQRRLVRVAVPYDRTIYVNDKGAPKGIAVDMSKAMQAWFTKQYAAELKGKTLAVKLVPTQYADLLTSLTAGKADMVIGDLGLYKPSANAHEYLLNHAYKLDREVLVSGPSAIAVTSFEDLAGQTVYGGRNTNFPGTLQEINKSLRSKGKAPVNIVSPVGTLDGEDLLEMVDAGLIPYVIIGDWKAKLWQPIYKRMVIHDDIFTADAGWIGYGVRSSNQDLNQVINKFIGSDEYDQALKAYRGEDYKAHMQGLKDPIEKSAWARFESMWPLFQKYGAQYNLDPLFVAALGFQETLLNQSAVSKVGAIGVMQLMPATGNSLGVGDIHLLEPNIHAGADYMNQLITKYFPDAQFKGDNRALFAVASYNIGPNNVAKARDQAKAMGFDPNEWFGNVEFVATQRMGYEPMIYVRNVYKYFISYELKLKKIQSIQP